MTKPEQFYGPADNPSERTKERMWLAIERAILGKRRGGLFITDRRSFYYGVAAAIALVFMSVGMFTVASNLVNASRPESIRLDLAYESAIHDFERFVPAVTSVEPQQKDILLTRKDQLRILDAAIADLKKDVNGHDLSPLKRARLRQLYSMKLHVVQEMIEQGEIDL